MSRGKGASTGRFLSEPNRILSQSIKGKSETNPKLYSKPFVFDRAAIEGQLARNQRFVGVRVLVFGCVALHCLR